jgi:hypothetical protein
MYPCKIIITPVLPGLKTRKLKVNIKLRAHLGRTLYSNVLKIHSKRRAHMNYIF